MQKAVCIVKLQYVVRMNLENIVNYDVIQPNNSSNDKNEVNEKIEKGCTFWVLVIQEVRSVHLKSVH